MCVSKKRETRKRRSLFSLLKTFPKSTEVRIVVVVVVVVAVVVVVVVVAVVVVVVVVARNVLFKTISSAHSLRN